MCMTFSTSIMAQPYGKGIYDANVPYGKETSLSIGSSGNVSIQITPTDSATLGTGNSTVTVTSTDVVGYKLYIRSVGTTNMENGPDSLQTSVNGSPATLVTNTWGYNLNASANFVGSSLSDTLIKTASGPFSGGDNTVVTFGVNIDNNKPAGNYNTVVQYTAVPQTD